MPADVIDFDELTTATPLDELAAVDPAQPAVIGWTSGTTGPPKGVLLESPRPVRRDACAHVAV